MELPPYMRRPTTRRAKVTGMRRCPWSMKTMKTSKTIETRMMIAELAFPPSS